MNFLEKLDYLMEKNHLNKSKLSKACDIPYTTIDGWYKKGYEGVKLTTLRKLAEFFGTSLDYWVSEDPDDPVIRSERLEKAACSTFKKLKPAYQEYVLKQMEQLVEIQNEEKGK